MTDRLLTGFDIANARGSPEERFVELSDAVRARYEVFAHDDDADLYDLRREYVAQLNVIADELEIFDLASIDGEEINDIDWSNYLASVAAARTRARLRSHAPPQKEDIVEVRGAARRTIQREINALRELVHESELSTHEKQRLIRKLDELLRELDQQRFSLSKFALVAASLAGVFGGLTGGFADAPKAAANVFSILQTVGEEQAEPAALPAPLKALPAPSEKKAGDNE